MTPMTDGLLRQFLLRHLPTDEAARLEECILLEDGFAERLRDEEFDLLDDYAASRLNAEDAAAVERHLLGTAENLHSLQIARALRRQGRSHSAAEPQAPPESRGEAEPQLALEPPGFRKVRNLSDGPGRWRFVRERGWRTRQVGVTLLAACLVGVVFIPHWRSTVPHAPDSVQAVGGAQNTAPAAGLRSGPAVDAGLPIVTLVADVSRGAARPLLDIEAGAGAVRLQAEVPEQAPKALYSLRIQDAVGQSLFEGTMLKVHTAGPYRFVEAVVPRAVLGPGERTVSLTASNAAASVPATFVWHIGGVVGAGRPK